MKKIMNNKMNNKMKKQIASYVLTFFLCYKIYVGLRWLLKERKAYMAKPRVTRVNQTTSMHYEGNTDTYTKALFYRSGDMIILLVLVTIVFS